MIDKIKLNINTVTVELTTEEAEDLWCQLGVILEARSGKKEGRESSGYVDSNTHQHRSDIR